MSVTEHGIEGGFGSGLRAKLERKDPTPTPTPTPTPNPKSKIFIK